MGMGNHIRLVALLLAGSQSAGAFNLFDGGGFGGYEYLKWGPPQTGTGATVSWSLYPAGTPGDPSYCAEVCTGLSGATLNFYDSYDSAFIDVGIDEFQPIIERAMLTWAAAGDITFQGPVSDTNTIPINATDATPPSTGEIRIGGFAFVGGATGGGAAGFAPPPNGGTGEGDIMFNTSGFYQVMPGTEDLTPIDFAFGNDLESLFLHELGHALGLAHSDDPASVMYIAPDGVFFINRALSADDIAGIQMLYGPASDDDGDGLADVIDNCTQVSNPMQTDADNDGIGNLCDADLDNNCTIDFGDLAILKGAFFSTNAVADLDVSGNVDFQDLALMKSRFFSTPGPSAEQKICAR